MLYNFTFNSISAQQLMIIHKAQDGTDAGKT